MPSLRSSLFFGSIGGLWSLASADLLPEAELITNCYNFPAETFSYTNNVKNSYGSSPHLPLDLGSSAVNFTLHDTAGLPWNLDDALKAGKGKPVALIWGMSSCPAYQGLDSQTSSNTWAYWDEFSLPLSTMSNPWFRQMISSASPKAKTSGRQMIYQELTKMEVEAYGDKATFVHMYGPEPHPASPDNNFDSGKLAANYWSTHRQATTYDARVAAAEAVRDITHPDQVILPDYLPGNPFSPLNQPVWCTYANGARSAIIVSESGTVFYQQDWLDSAALGDAIDAYWKQDGGGTWTGAPLEKGPLGPASRPTDKKAQKQQEKGPRAQVGKATP